MTYVDPKNKNKDYVIMGNITMALDLLSTMTHVINKETDRRSEDTPEQRARKKYPIRANELENSQDELIDYILATSKKLAPKEKTKKKKAST